MTFVSLEFGVLLLSCLIGYRWLPLRGQTWLLLVASYVFYAYWNPWYAWLIFLSTVIDYGAARHLASTDSPRSRRVALWISITTNLGLLGYFKYTNFGLHIAHELLGDTVSSWPRALNIMLPVGISFYTFQTMSYTIDVYRRRIPAERNFPVFALFVSFFPQLVAGPIERAADLLTQLKVKRAFDPVLFESGVRWLLWGFLKKLVIADRLFLAAEPLMRNPASSAPDMLFATLGLFTMLYFDFSAYTDMARGSAALFGVRLTENFRLPMAATSIAEFWRGWHITLSSWVRDYVYIPLGGAKPLGWIHQVLVSLFTMGLVGLWHGANWTYVVWGLQHGLVMVLYQFYFLKIRRRWRKSAWINSGWFALLGWAATMLLHAVGMAWFFSPDIGQGLACIRRMISIDTWNLPLASATAPGFVLLFILWGFHAYMGHRLPLNTVERYSAPWRGLFYAALFFIIVFLGVSKSNTFVYFQF